ncbi:MAG: CBS domain-containing protein [Fervidicoccaceae archaeon]
MSSSTTQLSIYCRKNIPFLTKEDKALRAREIIRETGLRVIPIFDDVSRKKTIGIVRRIDLLNISSTKSNLRVLDIMSTDYLSFRDSDDIIEALKTMLKRGEWYSIVEEKTGEFKGVFGLENGLKFFMDQGSRSLSAPLREFYTPNPIYVQEDELISRVWYLMLKHQYAGFPVLNRKGELVGAITQHDLLRKGYTRPVLESPSPPKKVLVREAMTTPPIALPPDSPLSEAVSLMLKKDIGRVYVSEGKKLVGVIDREDAVKAILSFQL